MQQVKRSSESVQHTNKAIDDYIRNEREEELGALADRLALQFEQRAEQYDRQRAFPFENFADLHAAGFLSLPIPCLYGGREISLYELVLVQERLARGDGSTALGVGWHLGLLFNLRVTRTWPEPLFQALCQDVVDHGIMLNCFATEPATGSPSRGGKPQTIARRVPGGWQISGHKTFGTLSPILDRFLISASIEEDDSIGEFLVTVGRGVTIDESWDTIGMRATGSHDVLLNEVFVPDYALLERIRPGESLQRNMDGSGWMLHIPACYLGIAYAARDFAVRFALNYQPNSINRPISELGHIQDKIGSMEAELRTARTVLYRAAARWDEYPELRLQLQPELGHAKYIATNAALRIVDAAMRIVGGASLSRSLPLERMYRDVRAGLHNPPMDDAVIRNLARSALKEFENYPTGDN